MSTMDIGSAASNITAALISSDAISVKHEDSQETVKNAVSIYSMVLTELMNRSRAGQLYKEP